MFKGPPKEIIKLRAELDKLDMARSKYIERTEAWKKDMGIAFHRFDFDIFLNNPQHFDLIPYITDLVNDYVSLSSFFESWWIAYSRSCDTYAELRERNQELSVKVAESLESIHERIYEDLPSGEVRKKKVSILDAVDLVRDMFVFKNGIHHNFISERINYLTAVAGDPGRFTRIDHHGHDVWVCSVCDSILRRYPNGEIIHKGENEKNDYIGLSVFRA